MIAPIETTHATAIEKGHAVEITPEKGAEDVSVHQISTPGANDTALEAAILTAKEANTTAPGETVAEEESPMRFTHTSRRSRRKPTPTTKKPCGMDSSG